jgi:hypothetical protein
MQRGGGGRGRGRGRGRGGSSPAATTAASKKDEEPNMATLQQQVKTQINAPPSLWRPFVIHPTETFPTPPKFNDDDLAQIEIARWLQEHFRYSGYNYTLAPPSTVKVERYSDRYRRTVGTKTFFDEISHPSTRLFPAEIMQGIDRAPPATLFASRATFISSSDLADSIDRLYQLKGNENKAYTDENGNANTAHQGHSALQNGTSNTKDDDEEEEEEKEVDEDELEDEDDMDGDYVGRYQEDDDGEGDDVFGEDEGEVM